MKKIFIKSFFIFLIIISAAPGIAAQVVNINGGIKVVAQGAINLVIDQGGLKNDGVFIPGNSTVFFGGAATTAISGTQPITFYNATFRGTGNKVNTGDASVIRTLAVEGTTVLDADGISNDKPFTLKSSDTITANVDVLTTGNIIGNVTVERFINTGTNTGQHAKSWQFLATPTTGQTFFQSWQESGLAPTGFGTWLTGTGTGFDVTTAAPSVKFYDEPTASWTAVTNTGSALQNKLGYMLFVRGDRTVTTYNGTPNNTNMRSKGVLFTPANPPVSIPVPATRFQTFGNPYASRIEFNKVYLASTGINDVYYAWDPTLNGSYNLGGYQTISGVAGYIPTAGNATGYYPAGIPAPYIESGQAVFVQGNGTGGNVNFNENCKKSGSRLINREPAIPGNIPADRRFLFTSLFSNTGMIADGNIVAFENGLGNELNQHDAVKIINAGENFGIARDGALLAVEARNAIAVNDTVFYHFQNLRQQSYQLQLVPVNMPADLTAFFIDKFDHSSTTINLADSNFINFTITAAPGSNAADRFMLVFKQATVVPVVMVNIAAARNSDQTVNVSWKVENEINLQRYEIQRSEDGQHFNSIGHTSASANNGGSAAYLYRDETASGFTNFYRIKAISNDGQIQYSNIVKVDPVKMTAGITVYPNPVEDNIITVRFNNQKSGNYTVALTNKLGQLLYSNIFYIDQRSVVQQIKPGSVLAAGTYQLYISNEDGKNITEQVIVR